MSDHDRLRSRLERIYPADIAATLTSTILERCRQARVTDTRQGWSEGDAMLITYADSITAPGEPGLQTLHRFLEHSVGAGISFLHLLPFYPWSSDDGFAVIDYRAIAPGSGDWADVQALAADYRLVFDGVINHCSAQSHYVTGYLAGDPSYDDFFIALDPATDTSSVLRTRNLPLLHPFEAHDGTRHLWTTFGPDQVDFNLANPAVLLEIIDILLFYAQQGMGMIRLDAIPYLWKELGTSCAHLPQTHELIKLCRDVFDLAAPHVLQLTETNVPHHENISYFGDHGDEAQMIYNFSLAPLILWSIHSADATVLSSWATQIEHIGTRATYLNITATHDGIGMRPTEGLLTEDQRAELVQLAKDHGGDITGKRNADGSVSVYELNISYFDALNDPRADEPLARQIDRFLCSQTIPLSFIGIPGIYIHSLLGSRNDLDGVAATGRARSINREQLDLDDLAAALNTAGDRRQQVFDAYRQRLAIRAQQPAFHPDAGQEILDLHPAVFALRRTAPSGQQIIAIHNVSDQHLGLTLDGPTTPLHDLLEPDRPVPVPDCPLGPYQCRWLVID